MKVPLNPKRFTPLNLDSIKSAASYKGITKTGIAAAIFSLGIWLLVRKYRLYSANKLASEGKIDDAIKAAGSDSIKQRFYLQKGLQLFEAGEYKKAIDEFNHCNSVAEELPEVHQMLARAYALLAATKSDSEEEIGEKLNYYTMALDHYHQASSLFRSQSKRSAVDVVRKERGSEIPTTGPSLIDKFLSAIWKEVLDSSTFQSHFIEKSTGREFLLLKSEHSIEAIEILKEEKLGTGGTGIVYALRNLSRRVDQVMKVPLSSDRTNALLGEGAKLKRLNPDQSPGLQAPPKHVVTLRKTAHSAAVKTNLNTLLIMEREKGSMRTWLKETHTQPELNQAALSIMQAFRHLRNRGIFHNDLKPDNILYRETKTGPECTIADFETSRLDKDPFSELDPRWEFRSTPGYYRTPDVERLRNAYDLRQKDKFVKYAIEQDVYAIGVTLFETLTNGQRPYDDTGKVFREKELRDRGIDPNLIELIKRMVRRDPDDRPYTDYIFKEWDQYKNRL